MKKLKFLIGFPIGIIILIISYLAIYLLDGQTEYLSEIIRLSDIKIFLNQILLSGTSYMIFTLILQSSCNFINKIQKEKGLAYKDMLVSILELFIMAALEIIAVGNINFAGKELESIFVFFCVISIIILYVVYIIKVSVTEKIINQKLKQRNAKDEKKDEN